MYDHTIEAHDDHAPFRVTIHPDPDAPDPRRDYSHMGTMYVRHGRYDLGDVPDRDVPTSWDDLLATVIENGATAALPLYLYEHGGLSMSAGDPIDLRGVTVHEDEDEDSDTYGETFLRFPDGTDYPHVPGVGGRAAGVNPFDGAGWDTALVGLLVDSDEGRPVAFGPDPDDAAPYDDVVRYLQGEVTEYDQYLMGDVYGYLVTDERTGENVDSCYGFFGLDDVREEALDAAAHLKARDDAARDTCTTCHDPYADARFDTAADLAAHGWTVTDPFGNVYRFHPDDDMTNVQLVPVCTDPHAQTPASVGVPA